MSPLYCSMSREKDFETLKIPLSSLAADSIAGFVKVADAMMDQGIV
jgi:hypothetical protein